MGAQTETATAYRIIGIGPHAATDCSKLETVTGADGSGGHRLKFIWKWWPQVEVHLIRVH